MSWREIISPFSLPFCSDPTVSQFPGDREMSGTVQHPLPPPYLAQSGSSHWQWCLSTGVISAAKQLSNSCDGCPDTESPHGNPSPRPLLQVSDLVFLFLATHTVSELGLLSDSFPCLFAAALAMASLFLLLETLCHVLVEKLAMESTRCRPAP